MTVNRVTVAAWLVAVWVMPATVLGQEHRPAEPVPIDSIPTDVAPPPRPNLPILTEIETADHPPRWLPSLDGLYGFSILRYNRVSGLVPAWGLTLEATDPQTTPSLGGRIGIATTHERAYWNGWAEQRLPVPGAVVVRYEHFQRHVLRRQRPTGLVAGEGIHGFGRRRGPQRTVWRTRDVPQRCSA
jgi:hypothetical protein